jgi:glycosyltransferase involved in cell wall biosynthesis
MNVIEALELLKKKNLPLYSQLKLIAIGGGRKKENLPGNKEFIRIKKSIREKKLAGKVIFLGSKKQSELKKYYSAAGVKKTE